MSPHNKFCLTIKEASEYFNIGENKIRYLAEQNIEDVALYNGVKLLIKRKEFEKFLDSVTSI